MPRPNGNKEASILEYFATAPIAGANVLFGIVRSTMKTRTAVAAPAAKKKATRKPRVRVRKPTPAAVQSSAPSAAAVE